MTVARPRNPALVVDVPRAGDLALPPSGAIDLAHAIELAAGEGRDDGTRDAIVLSARASALLRAGLAVRAFILDALTHVERALTLTGKTIVLEFGVYR
jgi:hypothetical protein